MDLVSSLQENLEIVNRTYDSIMENAKKIGGFQDNPSFRASLQDEVQNLVRQVQQFKETAQALKLQNPDGYTQYAPQVDQISEKLHNNLPSVIDKLRSNSNTAGGGDVFGGRVINQDLLDEETKQLEQLEQEVGEIIRSLREVQELYNEVHKKTIEQRHLMLAIEQHAEQGVEHMEEGNAELDKARGHQKTSTKCIIAIVVILVVVVIAVALILWLTLKK